MYLNYEFLKTCNE